MRTGLLRLAALVLPTVTAEAACTDPYYEYRCICQTCTTYARRQRRTCRLCNGTKTCSAWVWNGNCTTKCC
jgi:hypothetical protein